MVSIPAGAIAIQVRDNIININININIIIMILCEKLTGHLWKFDNTAQHADAAQ